MRKCLLIIGFSVLFTFPVLSQSDGIMKGAEMALRDLRILVALNTSKTYHGPTESMLRNVTFDTPIQHQIINLKDIEFYSLTGVPSEIIYPVDRVSVPVLDQCGEIVTVIDLEKRNDVWKPAVTARMQHITLLKELQDNKNLCTGDIHIVSIPELNIYFMEYDQEGQRQLALLDEKDYDDIPSKTFQEFWHVVDQLVPVAQSYAASRR